MVLQGGNTAPLQVTTGLTDGTNTEVTAGLQEGQAIVVGQSGGATAATGTVATGAGAAQRTGTQSTNPLTGGGPGGPVGGFAPPKP
jgi:HlyD family secretion protein